MDPVSLSPQEIRLALELGSSARICMKTGQPTIEILELSGGLELQKGAWAVLPASLNPPTLAHQYMVQWALEKGGFGGVIIILDLHHADKPLQEAHIVDRYLMAKLAFDLQDTVLIGLCSHGLFLHKAVALSRLFPSPARWSFLVGEDTLGRILDPKFYQNPSEELDALFSEVSFVVFERPGFSLKGLPRHLPWVPSPRQIQGVSSSCVRTRRRLNLPWKEFLCPEVAKFIERTCLYLERPSAYEARKRQLEELFCLPEGPMG